MRKVLIASLAVAVTMAFIPTAPAQAPGVPDDVVALVCETAPDVAGVLGLPCEPPCPKDHFCETLAASGTNNDAWEFSGTAGQAVHYFVDNVDSGADLRAKICATSTASGCTMFGDDETECTVEPPGGYACPEETGTLPADSDGDGLYYLFVGAWGGSFSGEFPHAYVGTLDSNGTPIDVSLVIDDDA